MVCEARKHAPGSAGRQCEQFGPEHDKRKPKHTRHQRQDGEFETVAL
jgi:hypothetical protein